MDTPLNLAHQQQRKADSFLKLGKFDESVACHQKATDLLKEALLQTNSEKAKESLELQLNYHVRQQAVVRHRQHQYETILKAKETLSNQINTGAISNAANVESPRSLKIGIETAIYRTMAENDSLLQVLMYRPSTNGDKIVENMNDSKDTTNLSDIAQSAVKMPKDDKMIIEELRMNNCELRNLVQQLITELEQENRNSEQLREENEKLHKMIDDLQRMNINNCMRHLPVHITVDSNSPYMFSPVTELSPGGSMRDLPTLPPLDLPTFDFNT
ncbi:nuclear receptor-binding factor 2-like [Centruroides sculpturatus]|uniref:nuclear receptor-binding factor 2-like n=1 Tax=Centruroides sculpturatus TaxID=218467 RepID=UPI000C6DD3E5|nr:nuclear receptor-binding factor 2-like [Centruroides sculpturatus]